ncbi:MAG: DUF1326 domain-containing protein [Thermoleophilia bacterium]|nr:DUF1326 domain-containing protein [Thermoleophilia bacterium]
MATTEATGYDLRGDLIEACSCMGPCPCWVADDPDGGFCNSFTGYHFRSGHARGVDVSGLSTVSLVQIPGHVHDGNWREVMFVDANASDEQHEALMDAIQGRLGGPLADLAALITDRVATYRVPIEYTVENGVGTVRVGHPSGSGYAIDALMEPYRGPDGEPTRLVNSAWNTIPGNEALVGKASRNIINVPEHEMEWAYEGRNSIQGLGFRMTTDE